MEGVNMSSRLPLIGSELHVGGVRADREPSSRSWAKIRTCLIDNPKDDEFNKRQEVWSYHNRNRGVVKSLLKKLPNVPFRIKRRRMKQRDIDIERDRIRETISRLPNISNTEQFIGRDSPSRNVRTRPLGMSKYSEFNYKPKDNKVKDVPERPEIPKKIDKNNNDNYSEMFTKTKQLPSLKERITRTSPVKGNSKLDENTKKVSFSMNDLSKDIDDSRCQSAYSNSSSISDTAIENYGHTSYGVGDLTARSVLDVFGNERKTETKTPDNSKVKPTNSTFKVSDNHKNWFQRVVGDKELIAFTEYENFARTPRQFGDRIADELPQTGKIPPEKQYSRSGWNVYTQNAFTSSTSNKQNNNDGKLYRGQQTTTTKVGARSLEARLNDQSYLKQSESEKLRRFDRAYQSQAQTQNRISERLTRARSPERYNQNSSPAQTQTPNRLADRLALSRSPDRMAQGQTSNRNISQKSNRLSTAEFNDYGQVDGVNASPSPTRFLGEYKLSKSPAPTSPGRYFPIFPTDGSPMRKIGGASKNKVQRANSRSQPTSVPLQETDTYVVL